MHRQVHLGRTVALVPVPASRIRQGLWTHAACRPTAVALTNLQGRLSRLSVRPFGSSLVEWQPPIPDTRWDSWRNAIGGTLGTAVASVVVLPPGAAHRRRFAAILLDEEHRQVGFAKWTRNPPNPLALEAEKLLSEDPPETFAVPSLIDHGVIDGWTWTVNAMVPPGPHRPARLAAEERRAITGEIHERLAGLDDGDGDGVLAHGDFAPWNVRTVSGRIYVLDWEDVRQAPEAVDEMWHAVTYSLARGASVPSTVRRARSELAHHSTQALAEAATFLRRRETVEPPEADAEAARSSGLVGFERAISQVLRALQEAPPPR